jgi:hypothetical protein
MLITSAEVDKGLLQPPEGALFAEILVWVRAFIARREQDACVCPFVSPADNACGLHFCFVGANSDSILCEHIVDFLAIADDWTLSQSLLALIMVFPSMPNAPLDDLAKEWPSFVRIIKQRKLTFAHFHPTSDAHGIYSTTVRPYRSPYPLLVARFRTSGDAVFTTSVDRKRPSSRNCSSA